MKKWMSRLFTVLFAVLALAGIPAVAQAKTTWVTKTTTHYYRQDGKWVKSYKWENKYNKKGKYTGYKDVYWNGDTKSTSESTYKYKSGRVVKVTYKSNGKVSSYDKYSYNKKKRLSQVKGYNASGKLLSVSKYSYNGKGYISKIVTTDKQSGNKTTRKYTYTYYSKNKIKKETVKTSDGYEYTYKYDKKGRETGYTSSEGYYEKITYSGNKISKREAGNKNGTWKDVSTYNSKGRMTKSTYTSTSSDGTTYKSVTTYKYKIKNGRVKTRTSYNEDGDATGKEEYTWQKIKA